MNAKKFLNNRSSLFLFLFGILTVLFFVYIRGGLDSFFLDSDFGRDLSEISKLWVGTKVIWLGPRLSPGLQASPLYYYMYYPAIWLSHGDAHSLIVLNILLGVAVLAVLGVLSIRKWGATGLLMVLFIGTSPLFVTHVVHPGNGYSYFIFVLASLISMWFEFPLVVSALFLGVAISFHPAAVFGVTILIYEWLRRKHSVLNGVLILLGLLIPWSPIILFEVITKGYLTRQWLLHKNTGIGFGMNLANINRIFSSVFASWFLAVIALPLITFTAKRRVLVWTVLCFLNLFVFCWLLRVQETYSFGIVAVFLFAVSIALVQTKLGRIILGVLIAFSSIYIFFQNPTPTISKRSIAKIDKVAASATLDGQLKKNEKIAVLAIIDQAAKVPQADDYRFFLRMKGYKIVETEKIADADKLVLFVEVPRFDWQNWSSWELSQFGKKHLVSQKMIDGISIIIYSKE